jgi:hypothetical protein
MLFELHRSLILLRNRAREYRREVAQSRSLGISGRRRPGGQPAPSNDNDES